MESYTSKMSHGMVNKNFARKFRVELPAIALFCLLSFTMAWTAEWNLIYINKGQGTKYDTFYYVHSKTITRVSSNKVRFWYLMESLPAGSAEPSQDEINEKGFKDYIELDCSKKRYRSVKQEMESPPGYVALTPVYWENIQPGSAYEKMADRFCQKKRPK